MTNPAPKKLSRRDAIKLLGAAAGASVLVNLPSKWSTPELASGVLPAHAQTSLCYGLIIDVIENINEDLNMNFPMPDNNGDGFASPAIWYCAPGCVEAYFSATDAEVSITTLGHPPFILDLSPFGDQDQSILVNLLTGEYALNGGDTSNLGGCVWLD